MIEVRKYDASHQSEWDAFIRASRQPMFMFERGFMDYHADRFEDASLMFYRDDELVALLPATRHGEEIRSHGGLTYGGMFVGEKMKQHTMMECFDVMKALYSGMGIRNVLYKTVPYVYQRQGSQEELYALFRNGATVAKVEPSTVVNLGNPYKMPKGRKAQISRARREGVVVKETVDFDSFIVLENSVLESRHGTSAVHTGAELGLLHDRFPERVLCLGGYHDGKLIAGTVLFVYDEVVHTQYLSANDLACEIGALDLVIAESIARFKGSHRYFDFGISSENGGAFLNEGLISQKEGFGGRTMVYTTYSLPI